MHEPPKECSAMSASVTSDEIKNELKTTLTARHVHELQQRHEVRPVPPPARPSWALTPEGRLTIALASMLVILALFVVALIDARNYYSSHTLMSWSLFCAIAIFLVNLTLNVRLHLNVKVKR